MDDSFSAARPGQLWNELQRLVAARSEKERTIASRYADQIGQTAGRFDDTERKTIETYETTRANLETDYVAARKEVVRRFGAQHDALQAEHDRVRAEAKARHKATNAEEGQKLKDARWEAHTILEATKNGPRQRLDELEVQIRAHREGLVGLRQQAEVLLRRRWQPTPPVEPRPSTEADEVDPADRLNTLLQQAQQQWTDLVGQRAARLFEGGAIFLLLPVVLLLLVVPLGLAVGWTHWLGAPLGAVAGLAIWGGMAVWLHRVARKQTIESYTALCQTIVDVDRASEEAIAAAKVKCESEESAIAERFRVESERADARFAEASEKSRLRRDDEIRKADEHYPPRLTELIIQREAELDRLEQAHTQQIEQLEREHRERIERLAQERVEAVETIERQHREAWDEMVRQWQEGMARFVQETDQLIAARDRLFFDWKARDLTEWEPAGEAPRAVPFGHVAVDLAQMDGGIPTDGRLRPERTAFVLPALLPFPDRSLLLTAADEGRVAATRAIQAIMLHLLTGVRPGKVRYTVIDPVGLGESFSAFMHLADFDDQIITSRIWTESTHIEQQLINLTEHMENVIQVYLRNEFETIQQYNASAGEMAEPYRVLVVAGFPTNFTESAARRLVSIVASGARCGVYVLLSVDSRMSLPHGFNLSDLQSQMVQLDWREGRFFWKDAELSTLPLELDAPPPPKPFTDLVRAVGERILEVDRVEVPFDFVVPDGDNWWKGDSARELDVPLGRAGAMKLQHLNLGRGTSQHVLVAGKTGSGKSNLLHAIITNVALWYGPDQVELYLVDFKKGVEFKPYAEYNLPHARVVAVESEREFGLSVLERLDAVLKDRGDRFRQAGVQDMAGWRRVRPDETMPRVVLVIDEFQELFVEDDRIAQNAALLLDRLVRQGRAFGMHVLLGSQTLAGAYSLPRATIGQMAVRIALQCSESDAHLILSEDNTAARLLTRPGEAIYNDANGLFEGNHPFQVVWLPDHDRSHYLARLAEWADGREWHGEPPIVFEGNAAADPRHNRLLERVLTAAECPTPGQPVRAWLGAAVAIKEPTSVAFRRQGGSNLLLVGHDDESALGILTNAIISLAAQTPLEVEAKVKADGGSGGGEGGAGVVPATFHILDGTRPEAPEAGFWRRFAKTLPHRVEVSEPRETAAAVGAVAAELSRRQAHGIDDARPIYLVIYDLGRFRDLRREEDTFRFSSRDDDEAPKPAAQLTQILREGPGFGVHTLIWCDTSNTLGRWLERQTVHDLEMRVAFQMSASDSSSLIDSADAARLGAHRAIYYDEGLGQSEKFRPYGVPSKEWLEQVRARLAARSARTDEPSGGRG